MKTPLLLLSFVLLPLAALAADVTGTWKSDFDSQIGHQYYTFTFKQDGAKLTGKANSEVGDRKREAELKEGKVEGEAISFVEMLSFQGNELRIAYTNGMDDFRRINHVPVLAANLNVGHGGTYGRPHGGDFAKVATAWLQWQLKGDPQAAEMFKGEPCGVAKMEGWKVEKKNIP